MPLIQFSLQSFLNLMKIARLCMLPRKEDEDTDIPDRQRAVETHSNDEPHLQLPSERTNFYQDLDGDDAELSIHTILSVPVSHLVGTTVNLDSLTMPCQFRLIECAAFLDSDVLKIVQYPSISFDSPTTSMPSFAAISYPWRDLQLPSGSSVPSFAVNGATHADPISLDVLRTACLAARKLSSCTHIWLDRLCILQTSKADKNWQIQRMYRIYSTCAVCLVLPGGLVRLAGLAEPTSWADRAWTLQEALAPGKGKIKCLFKLTHSSFQNFLEEHCPRGAEYGFDFSSLSEIVETVIEAGRSATCDMSLLCFHLWVGIGRFHVDDPDRWERRDEFPVRIITAEVAELLNLLLEMGNRPSLTSLWASAYTRSSSRPVDMVFSLMDLLGVNLDVSQFHQDERTKATIRLIQGVMKRGRGKATWLYIAPWVKPSREISTLPEMPETSESGRAYFQTSAGKVLAMKAFTAERAWRSVGLPSPVPTGKMTDSGYFVFSAKAALVSLKDRENTASWGKKHMKAYDDRETWAIVIGRLRNKNRNPETWEIEPISDGEPRREGVYELTMMLVEKHKFNLYHRVGMEKEMDERITVGWDWKYREFCIGGPGRGERVRFGAFPEGPKYL